MNPSTDSTTILMSTPNQSVHQSSPLVADPKPQAYELVRFNAVKHGILSRYTVLSHESRAARDENTVVSWHHAKAPQSLYPCGFPPAEALCGVGKRRKTIRAYGQRLTAERSNSPGVATGSPAQTPPPRPPALVEPTVSACEPHGAFIEAQLRLKRNFMAIYQDLVDNHGFTGAYNSVKRFAGGCAGASPNNSIGWSSHPPRKRRLTTARARPPEFLAPRATASHACL